MEISSQFTTDEVTKAIKDARLSAARELLQNKIRAAASDSRLRLSLIQLLCILGEWERVRSQLEVLESLGDENRGWINMLGPALMGEALRREVFAGRTTPLVLGEPSEWIAKLIQALQLADPVAQAALRTAAFEAAPATPVKVNGEDFPWLADADSRLGPVLEAIMEGKYYWIPFERVHRLSLSLPTDLRHLVWVPGQITWVTGGESPVLIPTRYVGTETLADDQLRLARKTTWEELSDNQFRGLGQRMFTAGDRDFPLLEVRTIEWAGVPAASPS